MRQDQHRSLHDHLRRTDRSGRFRRHHQGLTEPFGGSARRAGVVKHAKRTAVDRADADKKYLNDDCPTAADVSLFAQAAAIEYPDYGDRLVHLAFSSGLRLLELLALRHDSVDLVTGEIAVDLQLDRYTSWPATRLPKGNKTRTGRVWASALPLLESLVVDAQERHGSDHGWLFPRHRSTTGWADQAGKLLGAARESCDWPWDTHWLRHGYASWSLMPVEDGGFAVPLKYLASLLGHARPSTTADMYLQKTADMSVTWLRTDRLPGANS